MLRYILSGDLESYRFLLKLKAKQGSIVEKLDLS